MYLPSQIQIQSALRMQLSGVHIESNGSDCFTNITIQEVQTTALAIGIPGIVCLFFSIVGLVAELVFLCRIKNNFLLRLFLYLSVVVSITLGVYVLHLYSYWDQSNKPFCGVLVITLYYSFTVEQLLILSTNIVLLYKVYSSNFRVCTRRWTDGLSKSCYVFLEFLFVAINFGIPVITASIIVKFENSDDTNTWAFNCYMRSDNHSVVECNDQKKRIFLERAIGILIPVSINLILSLVCVIVLVIWLIWLQRRHFLRARLRTITKEIGLLLGYLIPYSFFWVIIIVAGFKDFHQFIFPIYPMSHIVVPISFFVYMFVSIRQRHKKLRSAHEDNHNVHLDQQTTGLETAPPSTRISLPSDTAAHAPNFLSPEELSEVTPLINN